MSSQMVVVEILDKEYQVACPDGQREALLKSARYLDRQMRSIKSSGKVIGLERIAVMAALNISNELLQTGSQPPAATGDAAPIADEHLQRLSDKLEDALQRFSQLQI